MRSLPVGASGCRRLSVFRLLIVSVLAVGCRSGNVHARAWIQFSAVPAENPGGPAQMDYIEGRVTGAAPGQQVVLYAHSGGIWWIQPFANQPFTKIQPDATWRNSTHLGTDYAAMLVEADYRPATKLTALPTAGNGVIAVATAKGKPAAPMVTKIVHFSGFDWNVRTAGSDRGGEPNSYDPSNVWVDENGYLHLRMQQASGVWTCAEVSTTRSLGYGTYRFVVQDTGHLSPSAVLGMYTLDDLRIDEVRSELDIELSRWGVAESKNAQYVVQPFYIPENVSRFTAPAGVLTHTFRWEPGEAAFKTVRGAGSGPAPTVSEHVFHSGIPTPGNETVHIDLYDYRHSKRPQQQQPTEVVIERFEFLP